MSLLQALDGYYDRMAARGEAEPPGWSREKIGFAIVLSTAGEPVDILDLRVTSGRKLVARQFEVPAAVKRTAGVAPNLLWDKSAYVLGRTLGEGRRTAEEHAAFRSRHLDLLKATNDEGLLALRRFLETCTPERFDAAPFVVDMLDANLVFQLDGDIGFVHEREAARRLVEAQAGDDGPRAACLVTGQDAAIQRLHPPIKGVEGAQSSGAALVSFNLDAFTSYNKSQGDNAPTSQAAAFRYGAALNRMLDRGGRNRLPRPLGDATVVFWADGSRGEPAAAAAEDAFGLMFNPPSEADDAKLGKDQEQAAKVRDKLEALAASRLMKDIDPGLDPGVRFHILGLSPNAARLSVRFWISDTFGTFAERLGRHYADIAIEPRPWRTPPAVQRLLVKTTAALEKFDNIPPQLAGEVTRAVLTGGPYPRSLLACALMRLRAGDDPSTGWHAAAIRAVLAREQRLKSKPEDLPVSLDRRSRDPAYNLGRLFAVYERAQQLALPEIKATIRDRYYGAASATPASVFPLIDRNAQNHLAKLRKDGKSGWLEHELGEICERFDDSFPRSLPLEAQGRFTLGYYHQRWAKRDKTETPTEGEPNDQ